MGLNIVDRESYPVQYRQVMTLIPMKLAEGPWPSLPASVEASSAQCACACVDSASQPLGPYFPIFGMGLCLLQAAGTLGLLGRAGCSEMHGVPVLCCWRKQHLYVGFLEDNASWFDGFRASENKLPGQTRQDRHVGTLIPGRCHIKGDLQLPLGRRVYWCWSGARCNVEHLLWPPTQEGPPVILSTPSLYEQAGSTNQQDCHTWQAGSSKPCLLAKYLHP